MEYYLEVIVQVWRMATACVHVVGKGEGGGEGENRRIEPFVETGLKITEGIDTYF